jgi:hypothetical protein
MTYDNIKNFTKSMYNHAKSGFQQVYPHVFDNRLNICNSCDRFNIKNITCKECGCFLMIKARWASEKCPLDKWGIEKINVLNVDDPRSILSINPQDPSEHTNFILPSGDCNCNKNNV